MKVLRLSVGLAFLAAFAVLAVTALQRPYDDQQDNLLAAGAGVCLLVALALLLAPLLLAGLRAVADEWKSRP